MLRSVSRLVQPARLELVLLDPQGADESGIFAVYFVGLRLLEDGHLVPLDVRLLGCAQLVGCRSS